MNNNKLKTVLLPVILALAIVLGMFINSVMSRRQLPMAAGTGTILPMQGSKLDLILNMINYSYVDTVDVLSAQDSSSSSPSADEKSITTSAFSRTSAKDAYTGAPYISPSFKSTPHKSSQF